MEVECFWFLSSRRSFWATSWDRPEPQHEFVVMTPALTFPCEQRYESQTSSPPWKISFLPFRPPDLHLKSSRQAWTPRLHRLLLLFLQGSWSFSAWRGPSSSWWQPLGRMRPQGRGRPSGGRGKASVWWIMVDRVASGFGVVKMRTTHGPKKDGHGSNVLYYKRSLVDNFCKDGHSHLFTGSPRVRARTGFFCT